VRQPGPICMSPPGSARTPARARRRRSAAPIARWSAPTIAGRAITSTSQPGRSDGSIDRIASRSRRRTRFRTTAEPRARPVARPNRVVPSSVRRTRAARSGWERIVPCSWSAAKSCGRLSISSRGRGPRSAVRPTGACDRVPGVRPGRGVRPSSSFGRGSRVPWRGGASWADRSASSCLRGILSVGPRGSVILDPERHVNAPAPHGAWRVHRSRDDRSASKTVSNETGARGRRRARDPKAPPSRAHVDHRNGRRWPVEGRWSDTPGEYRGIALRLSEGGAIVRAPAPPERSPLDRSGARRTRFASPANTGARTRHC
jgi:hypothetical protein